MRHDYILNRCRVEWESHGSEDRSLRVTPKNLLPVRSSAVEHHTLLTFMEIWCHPAKGIACNTKSFLKTLKENCVVYRIERSRRIQQHKDDILLRYIQGKKGESIILRGGLNFKLLQTDTRSVKWTHADLNNITYLIFRVIFSIMDEVFIIRSCCLATRYAFVEFNIYLHTKNYPCFKNGTLQNNFQFSHVACSVSNKGTLWESLSTFKHIFF